MLGGFDAFGEYVGAGLLGVGSDGGHDLGDRLVGTLLHQVQVELDHIGAQKGHQRQGVRVGADIVKCHPPARGAGPVGQGEQPGRVVGQRPFGELDHQTDPPLAQSGEQRHGRLNAADCGGLDVDEQPERSSQAGVQRRFQSPGLAQPVQLVDPLGAAGGREQSIGHRQRAAGRTAGERLERDRLTTAQVDDRLEDRTHVPRCQQRVQLASQLGHMLGALTVRRTPKAPTSVPAPGRSGTE